MVGPVPTRGALRGAVFPIVQFGERSFPRGVALGEGTSPIPVPFGERSFPLEVASREGWSPGGTSRGSLPGLEHYPSGHNRSQHPAVQEVVRLVGPHPEGIDAHDGQVSPHPDLDCPGDLLQELSPCSPGGVATNRLLRCESLLGVPSSWRLEVLVPK